MISRLVGAVAAVWLSGVGSAWAGGSADAGNLQANVLKPLCDLLDMKTTCPTLPTVTQLVLQIAGLENASPEMVRYLNSIPTTVAVNAANPPAGSSPVALVNIAVPLAFISPSLSGGTVKATDL